MSWITLVAALFAWCLIGLGVAYLFGRFIRGVEGTTNADDLPLPVLSYLRRRVKGTIKAPSAPSRATNQTKTRSEAIGGRRPH